MIKPSKVTSAVWGPFDQYVITGHEDGSISQFDIINVRTVLKHVIVYLQVVGGKLPPPSIYRIMTSLTIQFWIYCASNSM